MREQMRYFGGRILYVELAGNMAVRIYSGFAYG